VLARAIRLLASGFHGNQHEHITSSAAARIPSFSATMNNARGTRYGFLIEFIQLRIQLRVT